MYRRYSKTKEGFNTAPIVPPVMSSPGIITTYAGSGGASGFSGDGGLATSARLGMARNILVDASGNVFLADSENNRIRMIEAATGIIRTIAGNGTAGFAGDGGLATSASLHAPRGMALDASGNLHIADRYNHRIRRVDARTNIITTIAGSDKSGFAGDGGPATSARLNEPFGVALDSSGNIYIADYLNYRLRRVDATTKIITTIAGNGSGGGSPAIPTTGTNNLTGIPINGLVEDVKVDINRNIYYV
jgi:sugar lactone lactonase YvrE